MRGEDERESCFGLPAGCAGGEDDASALPSSFPDRGEADVAEQKRREKRQTPTAGRASGEKNEIGAREEG